MIMVSAQTIGAAVMILLDTVNLCVVKVVIILILKASKIVIIVTGTVSNNLLVLRVVQTKDIF